MNNPKFDKETLEAAKNGDTSKLVNKLSSKDKEKLNAILNDKKTLESILKSPQAAALLKVFGGKNG